MTPAASVASTATLESIRRKRDRSRSAATSDRITLVPPQQHRATLVFLHGFQMKASDLLADMTQVQECCPTWRIVLPQAPSIPITAHERAITPSWYDYLTDTNGAAEDLIDLASLRVARVQLEALISAEVRLLSGAAQKGDDYGCLFIGGLSQGGTMALDLAARLPVAGVLTLAAPRLTVSMRQPLLCPWHGLFARNDAIFPASWTKPLRSEAIETWCEGGHDLEGADTVTYLATALQKFEASRKDS